MPKLKSITEYIPCKHLVAGFKQVQRERVAREERFIVEEDWQQLTPFLLLLCCLDTALSVQCGVERFAYLPNANVFLGALGLQLADGTTGRTLLLDAAKRVEKTYSTKSVPTSKGNRLAEHI